MENMIWIGSRGSDGVVYIGKGRGKHWLVIKDSGKDANTYLISKRLFGKIAKDLEEQVKRASFIRA